MKLAAELRKLRTLKTDAEAKGKTAREAGARFKRQQSLVLDKMEAAEQEAVRTYGYLYTAVANRVKGQVEDRKLYIRWALEQDESIAEFLARYPEVDDKDFYDAITSTSIVRYKEDGHVTNQQARAHLDDGAPLPPGLTFRPDPYVSMTKA